LEHMIEHAFAGHVCSVHSPDSQGKGSGHLPDICTGQTLAICQIQPGRCVV
jgi:hypothetical protein